MPPRVLPRYLLWIKAVLSFYSRVNKLTKWVRENLSKFSISLRQQIQQSIWNERFLCASLRLFSSYTCHLIFRHRPPPPPSATPLFHSVLKTCLFFENPTTGWLGSRVVSVLGSVAEGPGFKSQSLSGSSLRQTAHTHCASNHQAAKLVAALLRVAGVAADLAGSNGSLPPGLWLTSPAGWLQRTGISSGTLRSVIEYGLPLPFLIFPPHS